MNFDNKRFAFITLFYLVQCCSVWASSVASNETQDVLVDGTRLSHLKIKVLFQNGDVVELPFSKSEPSPQSQLDAINETFKPGKQGAVLYLDLDSSKSHYGGIVHVMDPSGNYIKLQNQEFFPLEIPSSVFMTSTSKQVPTSNNIPMATILEYQTNNMKNPVSLPTKKHSFIYSQNGKLIIPGSISDLSLILQKLNAQRISPDDIATKGIIPYIANEGITIGNDSWNTLILPALSSAGLPYSKITQVKTRLNISGDEPNPDSVLTMILQGLSNAQRVSVVDIANAILSYAHSYNKNMDGGFWSNIVNPAMQKAELSQQASAVKAKLNIGAVEPVSI